MKHLPSRGPLARLSVAAAAALLLAACSEPPAPKAEVKPVFVTTVAPATAAASRHFSAVVRPRVESEVGLRTGGKLVERLVEVGDSVQAGQVLARLDPVDLQLAVKAAADQVQAASVDAGQAASDEARFRRLLADGSVGAADHERQKARADAAAARLDQARRQLELARNRASYTELLAPFAGVVTGLRAERGQVVGEGQPVVTLARSGDHEVVVELPEDLASRARQLAASATPWSGPGERLGLVLRELSPQASTPGRTYRARYAPAAASRQALAGLPLGSTVQLTLTAAPAAGSPSAPHGATPVALPVSALVKGSGPAGVWMLDRPGSGLVFTPVQVVSNDDGVVHVTGLASGSRVVSVGAQKLDARARVRPIERPADTAPTTSPTTSQP